MTVQFLNYRVLSYKLILSLYKTVQNIYIVIEIEHQQTYKYFTTDILNVLCPMSDDDNSYTHIHNFSIHMHNCMGMTSENVDRVT